MSAGREVAKRIGTLGVWCSQLQWQPAAVAQEAVAQVEALGYRAVWIGEATGKEILTHASLLLAGSDRAVIATGIASIWGRDPMAMANAGRTLNEAYPGRILLGLGVSHPFLTEPRHRAYRAPVRTMREYLDAMDRAPFVGPDAEAPPRVLAALGPRMLELARERTAGAHPYFVPVEHTARARADLGPEPLLAPEQAAVFEREPGRARELARTYTSVYLTVDNYVRNLERLGWTGEDVADGGSDRLVDALVAWGSTEQIVERLNEHLDAGADHVAVRVVGEDPKQLPMPELRELASATTVKPAI